MALAGRGCAWEVPTWSSESASLDSRSRSQVFPCWVETWRRQHVGGDPLTSPAGDGHRLPSPSLDDATETWVTEGPCSRGAWRWVAERGTPAWRSLEPTTGWPTGEPYRVRCRPGSVGTVVFQRNRGPCGRGVWRWVAERETPPWRSPVPTTGRPTGETVSREMPARLRGYGGSHPAWSGGVLRATCR